jgi:lipopolysaccharide transport system ATP-binding protein
MSSSTVISIENLSKRYIIGHQRDARDGLRHHLEDALRNPVKWLLNRKHQLQATREEFWALKDVSFEVKQGEVVGIIGRNGAGKSTLLKILSRITEPTAGRIRIEGRVASLLEVGTGFHQELTGRENIFLNGAILGMSRVEIKKKFDEIVAFSEVEKFLDTPVKRYSSGMYVRLAFAVAAHLEPEILIVDEVLAVGDAAFQAKCIGKLQNVASTEGRTVLFVSHQITAVQKLCTKGVLLRNGQLSTSGPIASVVEKYLALSASQTGRTTTAKRGSINILSWKAIDSDVNSEHACVSRQTCTFLLSVESKDHCRDLQIGFIIRSLAGEILISGNSRDYSMNLLNLRPGINHISVKVRVPLKAGNYQFDIAIVDMAFNILIHWLAEPLLTVIPSGSTVLAESWQGLVNEAVYISQVDSELVAWQKPDTTFTPR